MRQTCDKCRRAFLLLVCTVQGCLCAECWKRLGKPGPPIMTMEAVHQAELEAREAMMARGGADRHMVRAGRS